MKTISFYIRGNDSIQDVQDRFNDLFPAMKINFFREPDFPNQADQCVLFSSETKIAEINPSIKIWAIPITPDMRVFDLEQRIRAAGLHAEITCYIHNPVLNKLDGSGLLLSDFQDLQLAASSSRHYADDLVF